MVQVGIPLQAVIGGITVLVDLNPWAVIGPAVCISLLAIAVTVIGDRVYEVLSQRTAAR